MPRKTSQPITESERIQYSQELTKILTSFQDKDDLAVFLRFFLTPEEQVMLGKRIKLFQLTAQGQNLQQIKDALSVSYETARMYKMKYEYQPESFKNAILKSLKQQGGSARKGVAGIFGFGNKKTPGFDE